MCVFLTCTGEVVAHKHSINTIATNDTCIFTGSRYSVQYFTLASPDTCHIALIIIFQTMTLSLMIACSATSTLWGQA